MSTAVIQYFKNDGTELKFYNSARPIMDIVSNQKDIFFDDVFDCKVLGEIIFDSNLSPLTNSIPRDIFRDTFNTLFKTFRSAGSFEGYLDVFRKVFGDSVDVTFTVPSAGRLQIDIVADSIAEENFVAARIEDDAYVYDNVKTQDDDQIVLQSIKGYETQQELEQMLFEMVPHGVFAQITLTLGA